MPKVMYDTLIDYVNAILVYKGFSNDKAMDISRILIDADLKGIHSHGISRLKRYIGYIDNGMIDVNSDPEIVFETPISTVIDAKKSSGQITGLFAMNICIEKALNSGIGMAVVRNSNHYGIAGYYSEMANKYDMIGISATNTAPLVVPTNGKEAVLGTNPISVAFPNKENRFSLDMATSVASRGKIEVKSRTGSDIPQNWYIDKNGEEVLNSEKVIELLNEKSGGGLLPLGGKDEKSGSHKGYGLSLLVELLTSGLSIGCPSVNTYEKNAGICHFFAAIRLNVFGDSDELTSYFDEIINTIKNSEKISKIWYHGEKEKNEYEYSIKNGVSIEKSAVEFILKFYPDFEKFLF